MCSFPNHLNPLGKEIRPPPPPYIGYCLPLVFPKKSNVDLYMSKGDVLLQTLYYNYRTLFSKHYKNTSTFVFRFTIYCKVHITALMIDQTSNGYYIYHVTAICNLGFFIIHLSVLLFVNTVLPQFMYVLLFPYHCFTIGSQMSIALQIS